MNKAEILELLHIQKKNLAEFERLFRNYKKDGNHRKIESYLRRKFDDIDYLWSEIEANNTILQKLGVLDQPYFQEKSFESARAVYNSFIADINDRLSIIDNKSDTTEQVEPSNSQTDNEDSEITNHSSTKKPSEEVKPTHQSTMTKHGESSSQSTNQHLAMFKLKLAEIETFLTTAAEVTASTSRGHRRTQLEMLKEAWGEFRTCYFSLTSQDYQLHCNYAELQTKYVECVGKLNELDDNNNNDTAQMPKIKIPEFGGDMLEWPAFIGLFDKIVHTKSNIDNAIKIQYLKTSLKGEAAKLVSHVAPTADNYETCYDILQRRYNNKVVILGKLFDAILEMPKQNSESYTSLKNLYDTTFESIMAIKNLKINIAGWDPLLIHLLLKKLSRETVTQYECSLKNVREIQSFDEFLKYIETRFLALQSAESKSNKTPSSNNKSNGGGNANGGSNFTKCVACDGTHSIRKCDVFLKKPVNERFVLVKSKKLCVNCLSQHDKGECPSTNTCKTCNKTHHSLLHFEKTNVNIAQLTDIEPEIPINALLSSNGKKTLLATAIISAIASNGEKIALKALIDQGSQNAFITQNSVQLLNLKKSKISAIINGIGQTTQSANHAVTMTIKPRFLSNFSIQLEAIVLPKLANLTDSAVNNTSYPHLHGIILADPSFNNTRNIDIILGAAEFAEIIKPGLIKGNLNEPIAQNTELGWIISGESEANFRPSKKIISCISNVDLDQKINTFFETNECDDDSTLTDEQQMCETHYEKTHKRLPSGKYVVTIPLKNSMIAPDLGDSRKKALATFFHLEKRFGINQKLKTEYVKFINEYISLGHMELAGETDNPVYYLPHHAVLREDSTTTKLRVVFNASEKTSNGKSLNEQLAQGPLFQKDLVSIMLRWRYFKYVFGADIEKMYRQMYVNEEQQDLQRIFWRDSPDKPISEYKLKTITYGTANAPYMAIRTLFQLANDEESKFPLACNIIRNSFYVDDVMYGAHTVEDMKKIYHELRNVMSSANMNLRKWTSNSMEFLKMIPEQDRELVRNNNTVKALGLRWDPASDIIKYKVDFPQPKQSYTKRVLLSEMSSLFDPLGFISPVIIAAKEIFQSTWLENTKWDNHIPIEYSQKWNKIRNELNLINDFEIERWVYTTSNSVTQLMGFCDASMTAYAAVIYIKTVHNDDVRVAFLISRARVAPINQKRMGVLTIPKLELCSALLLARLVKLVREAMHVKFDETHLYTDSRVALAWINGNPNRWKVSVSNRVRKINALVSREHWHHVPGEINPADIPSRGAIPSVLATSRLWWNGPPQLLETNQLSLDDKKFDTNEEEKQEKITVLTTHVNDFNLPNVSSYSKLKRVVAYVFIFAARCKKQRSDGQITLPDLRHAEKTIIRIVQQRSFPDEIHQLRNKRPMNMKSRILQLSPFLDSDEILRVGGRLKNANVLYNAQHQILLTADDPISGLIIEKYHKLCLHGGARLTDSVIRQKYWLIKSRSKINMHVHKCIECFKNRPVLMNQIMADLPSARVVGNLKPFTNCAIDYTGELITKFNKGKGAKSVKSYASIFVCMSTKAIHIELVSDLTADAFIAALRRFVARRGNCKCIYSDNATCFVKANRLLVEKNEMEAEEYGNRIREELLRLGMEWKFSPPSAPHFNGLAEAAVKSVKNHLKRVVGSTLLTYEEISTLLCQVEACVNSRPLCAVSLDPNDQMPLTPGHFLIGQPLLTIPDENLLEAKVNWLTRWQLVQKMYQHFWNRWRIEYLNQLQSKIKWRTEADEPNENDLVLIKDDNAPPNRWPMGRILKLHRGSDGLARVVTVKTENNVLKRPIAKICRLPIERNSVSGNFANVVSKQRSGNIIPIITALLMITLNSSLISETNASDPFNITYVKRPMGLYFEEQTIAFLTTSNWNIYSYFDFDRLQCELGCIKSQITGIEKICKRDNLEYNSCMDLKNQLEKHFKILEDRNELIMSYRTPRIKRSFWEILDNALEILLETLNSKINSKYIDALHNISANNEQMAKLNKNQASILETTANILKHTDNDFSNQTSRIEQLLNNTIKINNTERAFQALFAASLKLHDILIQYESKQNELVDLISDSHVNMANSLLITPKQLTEQLEIMRKNIDNANFLLVEDAHVLYKIMRIKPFIGRDVIVFCITIPIFGINKFRIFKIIPIPMIRGNEYVWIRPERPLLLVSMDHQLYQLISESDYANCMEFGNGEMVCNGPTHLISSNMINCEFGIFQHINSIDGCDTVKRPIIASWTKLGINRWFFSLPNAANLISTCGTQSKQHSLSGTGILQLSPNCAIRGETIQLNSIREQATNPLRDMSTGDDTEVVLEETPKSMDVHDVHHYVLIYFALVLIAGILIFLKFRKMTFDLGTSVSMPNLASPENVITT